VAKCVQRRTADDVGLALPKRVGQHYRYVTPSMSQRAAYGAAENALDARVRSTRREQAGRIHKGRSALVDALMGELAGMHEQVIVYYETKKVLDEAERRLLNTGTNYRRIDGDTKKKIRNDVVEELRTDPTIKVLLGSRVLEYGLNLQHCRRMISLDSSWNPGRELQREGRIRRVGSPHTT
jgi:SNF2 family DNA or RNA helicase